ncbi:MAG: hypothetical protein IKF52_01685 [Clostridia bacterium]|nr:hypothetical protein [Clostridia bacterium]
MKKFIKKIFGVISTFIIGLQTKVFAANQTSVYGPPPGLITDRNQTEVYGPPPDITIDVNQTTVYGPPSAIKGNGITATLTAAHIFSIIASILLFIIGLIVIFNKKIPKKVKIIVSSIIAIAIAGLIIFCVFLVE